MKGFTILDRWLLGRFFKAYLTFTGSGVLVFVIVDAFTNLEDLAAQGLARGMLRRYATTIPELLFLLSPFLALLAALWVVAALSRQNELTPLLSAGYGPRRVAWPLILAGLILAPLCWADRELLLPSLAPLRKTSLVGMRDYEYPRPIPDGEGGVLGVGAFVPRERVLQDVRFTRLSEQGEELLVFARLGQFLPEGPRGQPGWLLVDGIRIEQVPAPDGGRQDGISPIGSAGWFLPSRIQLADVEAAIERPSYLSAAQLRAQLRRTEGFKHLEVQLYERFAQPLAGLVLLLSAVPLALRGRGGWDSFVRFLVCMALSLAYFVVATLAAELSTSEVLPPLAGAFLPVFAFGLLGLILIARDPVPA